MASVREPAVAGQFYPATAPALKREIESCYTSPLGPGERPKAADQPLDHPRLVVAPHAGYVYSGPIAAWAYSELAARGRPEVAVILGPNHRGITRQDTIETGGAWRTPLGDAPMHTEVATAIQRECPSLKDDRAGGRMEHSLEVQVPFLQDLYGSEIPIVPIMISSSDTDALASVAGAVASVIPEAGLIVASTDMTHFESAAQAEQRDAPALRALEAMDPEGLAEAVRSEGISMCGWAPTVAGLMASRELGLRQCRILRYGHSGQVSGDDSSVVAYAAALAE
jgi:hypothetical protein